MLIFAALTLLYRVIVPLKSKIIELVLSAGMGVAVVVMLIVKLRRECRASFYVLVAVLMLLTLGCTRAITSHRRVHIEFAVKGAQISLQILLQRLLLSHSAQAGPEVPVEGAGLAPLPLHVQAHPQYICGL